VIFRIILAKKKILLYDDMLASLWLREKFFMNIFETFLWKLGYYVYA